jgi:ribosomal protein S18 acetylase RimI-like enzyme
VLPPLREFSTQSVPIRNFANLSGFTLREMAAADMAAFIELGLDTCAFMHGRPETPTEKLRKDFASFVRDYAFDSESEVYIVEDPERGLAAQLWLHTTRNRFNRLDELWIWDITVREEYRRKGIGRKLMEFARHRAEVKNCAELWLLVSSKNNRAVRLYETVGLKNAGFLMSEVLHTPTSPSLTEISFNHALLRPLEKQDILSLYQLWTAAGLPFKPKGRDREDRLIRHFNGSIPGGWGAVENDVLIAAALLSFDGRKGFIERLATRPEHRRAGLARAVVMTCLQSLKDGGALVTAALIESENSASRGLFEACGFINSPSLCYYSIRDRSDS